MCALKPGGLSAMLNCGGLAATLLLGVLTAAPAMANNAEMRADTRATVGKAMMSVVPPVSMNRLSARPGKHAETWTLDGTQLNNFLLVAGVPAGEPLLRERQKKDKPLPRFASGLDATALFDLFAETLTAAQPGVTITPGVQRPAEQDGCSGVLAEWRETRIDDDIARQGRGLLCVKNGRFHAIALSAPALHYFARDAATVDALIQSARF